MMTSYSLVVQLARLIPAPRKHATGRHVLLAARSHEHFGRCPACHEFVGIRDSAADQRGSVCPGCGQRIDSLEPLFAPLAQAKPVADVKE